MPHSDELAQAIMDTMRRSLGLVAGVAQQDDGSYVILAGAEGHEYRIKAPTYYKAAVMLAEAVGFDLEE